MEQIIHTLSVLELIMLLPILLAGYRERKKYKNAEKLYELPALKIGQEIYQLKAGALKIAAGIAIVYKFFYNNNIVLFAIVSYDRALICDTLRLIPVLLFFV